MPQDCANAGKIPYMSTGTVIHLREVVFENQNIIVEDYAQQNTNADGAEEI